MIYVYFPVGLATEARSVFQKDIPNISKDTADIDLSGIAFIIYSSPELWALGHIVRPLRRGKPLLPVARSA